MKSFKETTGQVHSVETFGTVDGPGIRYILFLAGCPLRCIYCHNSDTWDYTIGETRTVSEVFEDLLRYKAYYDRAGGGITLSGGEPTLQPYFLAELFQRCQIEGIHTCLDTSGFCDLEKAQLFLPHTNLVLLDLKHMDGPRHQEITGVLPDKTFAFAHYLAEKKIPTWIRYVLVPGYTDATEDIEKLCLFVKKLNNVERITFLPFHQLGSAKRKTLNIADPLQDLQSPSKESIEIARNIARKHNLVT
ncbi:pyruvate formate lyase-activating protein [Heliorestis acidaminivorans]|uniref:Pyruvate formate-lyase-activating enzyme n=1 Tax=Heliorestis acidaminivorans TaxID=553427 RepID=A0A6I0EXG5_9FIRM|nr:pyruvate formate-lyase-activating protein [Heliorestis acidaminivorans]KAB2951933.1 pyruvate formate lyase-activating protein [Heliorestis acidaminivorans]